jgi:putative ABC transport system permease protein
VNASTQRAENHDRRKSMRFTDLVAKNLFRRPMRSALTLIALVTAIASVVALLGIAQGFTRSFGEIYAAHSIDIVVSRQGSADRLSSAVDQKFEQEIEVVGKVDRAAAVLLESMSLEDEAIYGIPTMGVARDSWYLRDFDFVQQIDSQGDQNDNSGGPFGAESRVALLGTHLADRLNAKPGKKLNLLGDDYTVQAIFRSPASWENGALVLPIEELQELTDRAGQATYINVVLERPFTRDQAESAISDIEALDSKLLPMPTSEFVETDTRMQLAGAMAWMTSVIALLIGAVSTLNTMLMSVMERTKEIGILRAIGWPKRRIVRMILLESCGLALLASVLGTLLAMLTTWGLSQAPLVKGLLVPHIDTRVMLQGLILALVIGLLGALLPAWRAARMLPTEAFREV